MEDGVWRFACFDIKDTIILQPYHQRLQKIPFITTHGKYMFFRKHENQFLNEKSSLYLMKKNPIKKNLDAAISSPKSLCEFLSPLSLDLARARKDGCSGLQSH